MEEQHATALRLMSTHLSRASPAKLHSKLKPENYTEHLKSRAVDADDTWLAEWEPAVQSLLIKKQPARLTKGDRAKTRCYSMFGVLAALCGLVKQKSRFT